MTEGAMPVFCGQEGEVCATPPGCMRHWEQRVRELLDEVDAARAIYEMASEQWKSEVAEAEERGARWALERHGNTFASKTLEQYAEEICDAARKAEGRL